MSVPLVQLSDTFVIPQLGLGLWQVKDEQEFIAAFTAAAQVGYRHFDSAQIYGNEHMIPVALAESGLKRSDIFITTKIHVANFGAKRTAKSFESSLQKLQTDYVDLLLLHFPVTGLRKNSWLELERIHATGKARSIGVSNYTVKHLEHMRSYANIMPAVNQVELHVFLQQPELREHCMQNGIVIEAYSPLAHGKRMDNATITEIAAAHNKSYAQIMLRWCVQLGMVVLPKSVTPSRIAENAQIFDFELTDSEMQKLASLDEDLRTCWDPTHVP